MEFGEKLKELNMTEEEIGRFSKAFKDEKFREMLTEYAEEISNPDNKKRYEEEIRLLEQERGYNVEFIHPEPFRCLRTSVNGQERCYINICSNGKVGKPSCKGGVSETGERGHCWSFPHCLQPGRQDIDQKGKKVMIYDVIFHPDTIYMASKSKKFMEIVDGAAMQGIQDRFKVTLDKNNVKHLKVKYKGTPQAPVIRKPIPGYEAKEAKEEEPDPLAIPYPDEKTPTTSKTTTNDSSATQPQSFQIQPEKTDAPTEPKHTVKYRSFFDLQDFRCSGDSVRSSRPKEIVVTIDLPLLKSAADTSLEIKEKDLLLESKKPAYRLELALAYPVDEDKGEAKFNRNTRQLIVTLPVLPSKEVFHFSGAPPVETVAEIERGDEDEQEEEEGRCEKQIGGGEKLEGEQEEMRQQKVEGEEDEEEGQGERRDDGEEEDEEEKRGGEKKEAGEGWKEPNTEDEEQGEGQESVEEGEKEGMKPKKMEVEGGEDEEGAGEEEKKEAEDRWEEREIAEGNVREEEEEMKQKEMEVEGGEDGTDRGCEEKGQDEEEEEEEEEGEEKKGEECEEKKEVGGEWKEPNVEEEEREEQGKGQECVEEEEEEEEGRSERQIVDCLENTREEEDVNVAPTIQMTTSDVQEETENTDAEKMGRDASFLHQIPSANLPSHQTHAGGGSGRSGVSSEEAVADEDGGAQREDMDEDDLTTEQVFLDLVPEDKPPVLLREVGEDGSEKVISDHSTSAGFTFQNSRLFELD